MPGLKLIGKNEIIRMNPKAQWREMKRVLKWVRSHSTAYSNIEPCQKAKVKITVKGPYRHDRHSVWIEDVLDAIVARRDSHGRRWGLITDDSPKVIGMPKVAVKKA